MNSGSCATRSRWDHERAAAPLNGSCRHGRSLLAAVLIVGTLLRLTGFDRGFDGDSFHSFHPDEETVVRAALELRSPLAPPLTVYGLLPLYLARGTLAVSGVSATDLEVDPWPVYRVLRLLAVALSCVTLFVVFLLGCRLFDRATAILASLFFAVTPIAIQQGHFYTVDAVFLLLITVALYALACVEGGGTWRSGVVVGLCIGLAAATRLNGLLLLPVAVAAVWLQREVMTPSMRRGTLPYPLAVVASTVVVVVVLQPYLLTSPELMWREEDFKDFWYSVRITSGARMRFWSLFDHNTTPYLHHIAVLLPLAIGMPLTILSISGVAFALRRWRSRQGALLLWGALFFLVIGGLHTKHVRYLLPLLPVLLTMAAALCMGLWRMAEPVRRYSARVAIVVVSLFSAAYGVAFSRIYLEPDSRIVVARWLQKQLPEGATLGLETGGFSLRKLVDPKRFDVRDLEVGQLFLLRGYLSCGASAHHLWSRLREMQYVVTVDVNRHAQVAAAPDVMPSEASFYQALEDQQLGYRLMKQASNTPRFLGWDFGEDDAEPSFFGYDHPTVRVYQRQPTAAAAMQKWRDNVGGEFCPDALLADAVARSAAGDAEGALRAVRQVQAGERGAQAGWLLLADIYGRQGDDAGDRAAFEQYQMGYFAADDAHLIPWATSLTLAAAGDPDLALTSLMAGVLHVSSHPTPVHIRWAMARSYHLAADFLQDQSKPGHARRARELAAELEGGA